MEGVDNRLIKLYTKKIVIDKYMFGGLINYATPTLWKKMDEWQKITLKSLEEKGGPTLFEVRLIASDKNTIVRALVPSLIPGSPCLNFVIYKWYHRFDLTSLCWFRFYVKKILGVFK